MFNANPLMRYDGYYILSDLMEIPNLRQKASTILHRKLGKWCLGLKEPDDPFLPERHQAFFALYSVASAIYRWVVTFSILWFLYKVFEPYRLQIIGQILAGLSLVQPDRHAAVQDRPVLLSAGEGRSSEEAASICHAGRAGRGRGGDRVDSAAVSHRDAHGSACAIQTLCMCP